MGRGLAALPQDRHQGFGPFAGSLLTTFASSFFAIHNSHRGCIAVAVQRRRGPAAAAADDDAVNVDGYDVTDKPPAPTPLSVSVDQRPARQLADRDHVTSLDDFRFRSAAAAPIYNKRVANGMPAR